MYTKLVFIVVVLASLLSGCNPSSSTTQPPVVPTEIPTLEFVQPTPIWLASPTSLPTTSIIPPSPVPLSSQQEVMDRAFDVISVLKQADTLSLSAFVHPVEGLRLSPFTFVMESDQLFTADQIANMPADSKIYTWREYASSGEPINLGFMDYYSRYIYDVDFANAPQISLNYPMGLGSTIDNASEFFPGSMIVEFYFSGFNPQYEGMDFRSLRLVFVEYNNTWYLVGMIHNQWTP